MCHKLLLLITASIMLSSCTTTPMLKHDQLIQEVTATEIAFAKTMADRDLSAFATFISEDAVFLNGGKPLHGKKAIVDDWSRRYLDPIAPFSWKPDLVEVSRDGKLAESIGPVSSLNGEVIARYYSTWRREPDGKWRIVFDNGYESCK